VHLGGGVYQCATANHCETAFDVPQSASAVEANGSDGETLIAVGV